MNDCFHKASEVKHLVIIIQQELDGTLERYSSYDPYRRFWWFETFLRVSITKHSC